MIKYTLTKRKRFVRSLTQFWVLSLCLMCHSCKTRYIERDVVRVDSIRVADMAIDTLIKRDSVFIRERGDTIEKVIYKYIKNVRIKRDTVFEERTDTILQVRTQVETKIERRPHLWSCLLSALIGIIIGTLLFLHSHKS